MGKKEKKKRKADTRCCYCGRQYNSEEMTERLYLFEEDGNWEFECPDCGEYQPYKSKYKFGK